MDVSQPVGALTCMEHAMNTPKGVGGWGAPRDRQARLRIGTAPAGNCVREWSAMEKVKGPVPSIVSTVMGAIGVLIAK